MQLFIAYGIVYLLLSLICIWEPQLVSICMNISFEILERMKLKERSMFYSFVINSGDRLIVVVVVVERLSITNIHPLFVFHFNINGFHVNICHNRTTCKHKITRKRNCHSGCIQLINIKCWWLIEEIEQQCRMHK